MGLPRIEIVIPTLDRAEMLAAAIKSALAQDYPDLGVIVSDNASSDATPEVCRSFSGDPRFRHVRQVRRLPMYEHWHRLLEEAVCADWVLLLSDDDMLVDTAYISKAARMIAADPRLVMVHADFDTLLQDSGAIRPTRRNLPEYAEGNWYFMNYRAAADVFCLMTVIFRRSAARDFVMFSKPEIFGSDTRDLLRLSLNGRVGFVRTAASVYRVHRGRTSEKQPWRTYFDNLEHIYAPYLYAKGKNAFSPSDLKAWLCRLFGDYLLGVLGTATVSGGPVASFKLFGLALRRYPGVMAALLRPGFLFRAAAVFFSGVRRWLRGGA